MKQNDFFGSAKWIGKSSASAEAFFTVRGRFSVKGVQKATLFALGLGFFKAYVNGALINPDTFLPLSSEYEKKSEPTDESLSAQRVYVPSFDVTPYLKEGENVIAIAYGGGWYTSPERFFGVPKAIYRINVQTSGGEVDFVSDEKCRVGKTYVDGYYFHTYEKHDYNSVGDFFAADFDDSAWDYAEAVAPLVTEYCETDCPKDKLIKTLSPKKLRDTESGAIFDCGENTVGYPVLRIKAKKGETVKVRFSEELTEDCRLDERYTHGAGLPILYDRADFPIMREGQAFIVKSDGRERIVQPEFTWFGFRYLEVLGNAELELVKVVHSDVPVTGDFECDDQILTWTYRTFVHTMLCNMHTGHPSDCPHLERRGYTGDGQLTLSAVLNIFDAKAFYEKWLQDIADGQDSISGHVQNAAPYVRSGGGPGGWGCAIVEVPYLLYERFGDKSVLQKYYGNMRRYIDYLDAHSEFGLVTSDKKGEWCLGDWCAPNVLYPDKDLTFSEQQMLIPTAYVNTYFAVKALEKMRKIALVIGKNEDAIEYERKIDERKRAVKAAYYNAFDGNYIMNAQGANAFAVDIGLDEQGTFGKSNTYLNLVDYYKKIGCYDTGIFATEILTRILFERGDGDLAVDLLRSNGKQGFARWKESGATTFHEYWDSERSRSHNHPMRGAIVTYFFKYLLGIRQEENCAGYKRIKIAPCCVKRFKYMRGYERLPSGIASVSYNRDGNKAEFTIEIPEGVLATFEYSNVKQQLKCGKNFITIDVNA